ncbi:hypothetical protein [uncultured Sphingomonas sp.]|uniref:hypothetical protein n=1 Tax=uncultured Sphingomonas sp. TaxID=158754 RepID=UPI0035CC668C
MTALEARAQAIAEARRDAAIAKLADRLRAALPGVRVEQRDDGVTLIGRRLSRDPRLTWIGSLMR